MNEQIPLNKLRQSSTPDLQAVAEAGDALAQRVLGERYATFDEIIPPQDGEDQFLPTLRAAERWLTLAAEQGDTMAMRELGDLHSGLLGEQGNIRTAWQWYERAGAAGDAAAQNRLGILCENGMGRPRDYAAAAHWYELAAASGEILARFNLALLLSTGRGVQQDGERALQLLAEVAATGDGMGDYYMAELLEKGRGVARDLPAAIRHYEAAREKGVDEAVYALGRLYFAEGRFAAARPYLEAALGLGGNLTRQADRLLRQIPLAE